MNLTRRLFLRGAAAAAVAPAAVAVAKAIPEPVEHLYEHTEISAGFTVDPTAANTTRTLMAEPPAWLRNMYLPGLEEAFDEAIDLEEGASIFFEPYPCPRVA